MKCGRCPIHKECNKGGKITIIPPDGEGKPVKVCPLLWAIQYLVILSNEIKE